MISVKNVIRHFPNAITLLNLVAGSLSIVAAFEANLRLAGILIVIAAIFDFLDGFTARFIGAYTLLGKELDSLSDVVSFGVAPSVIIFHFLKSSLGLGPSDGLTTGNYLLAAPFVLAAFSSLRLGIFNIDERQTSSFIGLPTPASALFTVGLIFGLSSSWGGVFAFITTSSTALLCMIAIQSAFLVCELPMFSLKLRTVKLSETYKQQIFGAGIIALLVIFGEASLSFIIIWYIVLSAFFWILEGFKMVR